MDSYVVFWFVFKETFPFILYPNRLHVAFRRLKPSIYYNSPFQAASHNLQPQWSVWNKLQKARNKKWCWRVGSVIMTRSRRDAWWEIPCPPSLCLNMTGFQDAKATFQHTVSCKEIYHRLLAERPYKLCHMNIWFSSHWWKTGFVSSGSFALIL